MVEGQQIWQKPKETMKGIEATRQGPGAKLSDTREHEKQPRVFMWS